MQDLFNFFKKLVTYDAERDFYAKYNPSTAGDMDLKSFRPMRLSDLGPILEIEQQVYNFPWSDKTFRDCLSVGYLCWVCERVDQVVAYGILSIGAGEAHVMNICVSPRVQRQGYGVAMMNKLIEVALENRTQSLLLEVRPTNFSALEMYRKMGFNEIGVRKAYYPAPNGREDALMLGIELSAGQQQMMR